MRIRAFEVNPTVKTINSLQSSLPPRPPPPLVSYPVFVDAIALIEQHPPRGFKSGKQAHKGNGPGGEQLDLCSTCGMHVDGKHLKHLKMTLKQLKGIFQTFIST